MNAHVMFNGWELPGQAAWPDLQPAGAPREDGSDWWSLLVDVPADAFEVRPVGRLQGVDPCLSASVATWGQARAAEPVHSWCGMALGRKVSPKATAAHSGRCDAG